GGALREACRTPPRAPIWRTRESQRAQRGTPGHARETALKSRRAVSASQSNHPHAEEQSSSRLRRTALLFHGDSRVAYHVSPLKCPCSPFECSPPRDGLQIPSREVARRFPPA